MSAPRNWPVGPGPHSHSGESVPQIMWTVVLALLPTCVAGVVVFGWYAGMIVLVSTVSALAAEAITQRVLRRPITVTDGSAVVTGVLLGCCLPPNCSWYVPVAGSFIAIVVGKQLFGGLGRNWFNPALVGRASLQLIFPSQMSMPQWPMVPRGALVDAGGAGMFKVASGTPGGPDAQSFATPLSVVDPGTHTLPASVSPLETIREVMGLHGNGEVVRDLFLGNIPGCIGEVSKLAIVLGAVILVINRYIHWRLPLAFIGAALAAAVLLPVRDVHGEWGGLYAADAGWRWAGETLIVHLLSGGLLLGAVFMIADPVTRPVTARGQVFYGMLAGLLVGVLRLYGPQPEGVCYAILLAGAVRLAMERWSFTRSLWLGRA